MPFLGNSLNCLCQESNAAQQRCITILGCDAWLSVVRRLPEATSLRCLTFHVRNGLVRPSELLAWFGQNFRLILLNLIFQLVNGISNILMTSASTIQQCYCWKYHDIGGTNCGYAVLHVRSGRCFRSNNDRTVQQRDGNTCYLFWN